tara:strand:- start:11616 stop:12422 length:807 start_codon:yes stop_codon:yes gene_type:complete
MKQKKNNKYLKQHFELFLMLLKQDIQKKYKGNFIGNYWIIITPLFMLSIYTFVFGYVFAVRWPGFLSSNIFQFSLVLYCGLAFYNSFNEAISRAPNNIIENVNYVKKAVFPLEILTPILVSSSATNLIINIILIAIIKSVLISPITFNFLFILLILFSFLIMLLGLSWIFSAIGVYIRDLNHLVINSVTGLLFLSPIFYPMSSLPEWLRPFILFNPISIPVEEARKIIIYNEIPDFYILSIYSLSSLFMFATGYYFFSKTKKGFSDVI